MALSPNAAYDANRNARIIGRKKGSMKDDDYGEIEAEYTDKWNTIFFYLSN